MDLNEQVKKLKARADRIAGMNPILAAGEAKQLLSDTTIFLESITKCVIAQNLRNNDLQLQIIRMREQLGGLLPHG